MPGASRPSPSVRSFRPMLERLECRELPAANVTATLFSGVLRVWGTADADRITLGQLNNRLWVRGVSVTTATGRVATVAANLVSRVEVWGLEGNDRIALSDATGALTVRKPAVLKGGAGDDTLIGGMAADVLLGGLGNDILEGAGGDDQLVGGQDNDQMMGGMGNDRYVFTTASASEMDIFIELTNQGSDILDFSRLSFGDSAYADIRGPVTPGIFTVVGGTRNRLIQASANSAENIENILGSPGDDYFVGNDANNVIQGGNGNDFITGWDGNDKLVGGFLTPSPSGKLTLLEVHKDMGMGGNLPVSLDFAFAVETSRDGRNVYVAASGSESLVVFQRDPVTGRLTYLEAFSNAALPGLGNPRSLSISPDGKHVYVAGGLVDTLTVFARDPGTGGLTFVEMHFDNLNGVNGLDNPHTVTVSPDGKNVYVAGEDDNTLGVFRRNATTGRLTFVQSLREGQMLSGGRQVRGLNIPRSITVSPDGNQVYVVSRGGRTLASFRRNLATGVLSPLQLVRDGVGGVHGLDFVTSVTISPDGQHLYTTAANDGAIGRYRRDRTTGIVVFLDTMDNWEGLEGVRNVRITPDGKFAYAAGLNTGQVVVFSRDVKTGGLRYIEALNAGGEITEASWVSISSDGRHVYVSARVGSLAVFAIDKFLAASDGDDQLFGEAGVDTLIGGTGINTLVQD